MKNEKKKISKVSEKKNFFFRRDLKKRKMKIPKTEKTQKPKKRKRTFQKFFRARLAAGLVVASLLLGPQQRRIPFNTKSETAKPASFQSRKSVFGNSRNSER